MYSTLSRKKRQAVSSVVSTMEQNSFCSFRNCFFSFRRKDEQFSLHRPTLTSFHVHRFHCLFLCLKFCTLHRLTLTSREMYLLLQYQCCKLQHQCSVTSSVCHIVTGRFFRGFMCFLFFSRNGNWNVQTLHLGWQRAEACSVYLHNEI